jgi:2-hydroxycyclohexanecarboxyl-CoA dehydrogenase
MAPRGRLAGRVALVSGAAQGLGRQIALRLAREGARVAVNDREDSERLVAVVRETGGLPAVADVSDPEAVERAVARVQAEAGPVDVLVANHAYMAMTGFLEHHPDDWWRQIDVNLSGTFHLVRSVLPGMRERRGGRMVFIASEWGAVGWPNATGYCASKAGVISLAKTLGRELAPDGIGVNAIAPGIMDTPQLDVDALDAGVSPEEIRALYGEQTPIGRIGRPEEVAAVVAFLASDASSAFVGQVLQPNGGSSPGFA